MKNADPFAEWYAFFCQVVAAVFIDKTAPGIAGIGGKTGIIILPGEWIYFFVERHAAMIRK